MEIVVILATFAVIRQWLLKALTLTEAEYSQSCLLWQELQHPPTLAWYVCCFLGALRVGRNFRWSDWDGGRALRYFITGTTAICAWAFSLYEINHYFAQWHLLDRLLVVALAIGVWRHPLWMGPFLGHTMTMVHQFHFPLRDYPWTDKRAPFALLMMFVAVLTVSLWRRQTMARYLSLSLCLIGANYFWAGWQKLVIGWQWHEDISTLFVNSYLNGWVNWLSEPQVASLDVAIEWLNPLLIIFTLAAELSALCLPLRKGIAITVLAACTLLHVGIFAFSGICFWKWAAVNVGLILLLARGRPEFVRLIFHELRPGWLAIACVLGAPIYARVTHFAWYDTTLSHQFDVEVVGASGATYPVSRGFFAPYDFTFAQNKFAYLSDAPVIVGTYGVTPQLDVCRECADVDTVAEYLELSEDYGTCVVDAEKAACLGRFLQQFLWNYTEHRQFGAWADYELVPHHIWSGAPDHEFAGQEPIAEIRVFRRDLSWDEVAGHAVVLNEELVGQWPALTSSETPQLSGD